MTDKIEAFWFCASDKLPNGDDRKIIVGKKHSLRGPIIMCKHALHASRTPLDALSYAPGPYLYRVRCWGDVAEETDKLGARHREYVAMVDATNMLRSFAREQALSVIHFWDAPEVVKQYLETGNEALISAARSTARSAARSAARSEAWSAAESAAESAARSAAESAAESAAWSAAWSAARSAAESAAWSAGRSAAWSAARSEAWSAARSEARKRFNELTEALFAGATNA
jgi:hypothetical protein